MKLRNVSQSQTEGKRIARSSLTNVLATKGVTTRDEVIREIKSVQTEMG
jgi:hypothetical protein